MEQVKGVVTNLSSKAVGQKGSLIYSFKVVGDNRWFKTSFKKPKCVDGDYVEFPTKESQYGWQVEATEITIKEQPAGAVATKSTGTDWAAKDKYDKEVRQHLIMYQSCASTAADLAVAALNNNILPVGTGKKELKYDAYMACVRTIRDELYADCVKALHTLEAGKSLVADSQAEEAEEVDESEAWGD